MNPSLWLKQTPDEPLFQDLLWSRPETKRAKGKLLIIGGNLHGLAAPAKAYEEANKAGAGTLRLLLPDATFSLISRFQGLSLETVFAASTPSGSFAMSALGDLLEQAVWGDGVLLAGDMSRNSETAILLEKFLSKFDGQVTLVQDAADYITNTPQIVRGRKNTTLVLTVAQAQKLFRQAKQPAAITLGVELNKLVELLLAFHELWQINIITKLREHIIVIADGKASVTQTNLSNEDYWRIPTAAHAAVWWLQNPQKTFESLTTSLVVS